MPSPPIIGWGRGSLTDDAPADGHTTPLRNLPWAVEDDIEKETTMKTLTTWNPARDLENIRGSLLGILGRQAPQDDWGLYSSYEWTPPIDVAENESEYMLVADLPAVRREDIHVTLGDGSLELSGERARVEGNPTYHRAERGCGKFWRTFYLPDNADPEKMKAEYRDGTLTVKIPKTKGADTSRKEIPVG